MKIGPAKFFRDLHDAQSLAVALRVRHAEIAVDTLLHVAGLLIADDENFLAVKAGHAANNGGIVAETAVAVNFAQVGENALDVVEGLRALRMAGKFRFLPGGLLGLHLFAQSMDAFLELRQLAMGGPHPARQLASITAT